VGQATSVNISLAVTEAITTIEVSTGGVQVENADLSTNFGIEQVAMLSNRGNDLSACANEVLNRRSSAARTSTRSPPIGVFFRAL
jgi:hypothetical protein